MLPPGLHSDRVPKDFRENLEVRGWLIDRCDEEPAYREAVRQMCREDILFYISLFVWQFNPRKKGGGEVGPFVTWAFQDEAVRVVLDCIETDSDLLIEKSREMGASWLLLIVFDWLARFHPRQKFLCISRSEEAVESADEDSLFWKLDFIHDNLPAWLGGEVRRTKRYVGHANTRSSVTGQASTGKAGVGGRASAMLIDEFSQIKEDFEVLHRTSDTTGCRVFNGTHKGLETAFFELSQRVDMRKLVMHWTQHPDKVRGLYKYDAETNQVEVLDKTYDFPPDFPFVTDGTPTGGPHPGVRSPWYDEQCRRKGSARAIAMDLDIDPRGSVSQFFDALTINRLKLETCDPYWRGYLHYDKDSARPVELVPHADGRLKLWMHPLANGKIPAGKYAAGADVAVGTGATPSCLTVVDAARGVKVLEYADPFVSPEDFARLSVAVCRLFADRDGGGALFAWEAAGPGLKLGQVVMETGYRRVYYKTDDFGMDKKTSDKPGWYPLPNNKLVLLRDYQAALSGGHFENRSWAALDECLAFKYGPRGEVVHAGEQATQDPTGARVNHGDRVIADALAWKMVAELGLSGPVAPQAETRPGSLQWRRELTESKRRLQEAW